MNSSKIGISSIGIHLPPLCIGVETLAKLRGIDPKKYTVGLGCKQISLCPPDYGVVALGVEAANRAIKRWSGNIEDIGLIAVGTESGVDMSRPLSNFIGDYLSLSRNIRSYEVKHACYGGTLAIRQALEWKLSGVSKNKAALVIAVDESLYAQKDAGEPTQGAGAIALIIDNANIAEIDLLSYSWSKPVFDFWRPVGDRFPRVDGHFSIECYKEAARGCFQALKEEKKINFSSFLANISALCFHTPYPKMVQKVFLDLCHHNNISEETALNIYKEKVFPTLDWNIISGNSYTASLWMSVAKALSFLKNGQSLTAFSYGSGCGSELLWLTARKKAEDAVWEEDIEKDIHSRRELNAEEYQIMRNDHEK